MFHEIFFSFLIYIQNETKPLTSSELEQILYSQQKFGNNNQTFHILLEFVDFELLTKDLPILNKSFKNYFNTFRFLLVTSHLKETNLSLNEDYSPKKYSFKSRTINVEIDPYLLNSVLEVTTTGSITDYYTSLNKKLTTLTLDLSGYNDFGDKKETNKKAAEEKLRKIVTKLDYTDSDTNVNLSFSKKKDFVYIFSATLGQLDLLQSRTIEVIKKTNLVNSGDPVQFILKDSISLCFSNGSKIPEISNTLNSSTFMEILKNKPKFIMLRKFSMKELMDELNGNYIYEGFWKQPIVFSVCLYAGLILLTVILVLLKI